MTIITPRTKSNYLLTGGKNHLYLTVFMTPLVSVRNFFLLIQTSPVLVFLLASTTLLGFENDLLGTYDARPNLRDS